MTDFFEGLSDIFKALSDPTRLKIFSLLMFNDEDKRKVIDLAEKIGISQPAATQHINILKDQNLITLKRDKNSKYYYINRNKFTNLKNIINQALDSSIMRCTFNGKCSECPRHKSHNHKI
ncbi:MAG: ArsR/SmtB family transcription factor [Promethearchaeota archaeon]